MEIDIMTIEERKQEARDLEELQDHITNLLETDDKRFSFEWAALNPQRINMEIYDKEKEIGYIVKIEKIKYDETGEAVNI